MTLTEAIDYIESRIDGLMDLPSCPSEVGSLFGMVRMLRVLRNSSECIGLDIAGLDEALKVETDRYVYWARKLA